MAYIETHAHIYSGEYRDDIDEVVTRARKSGADKVFLPAENIASLDPILRLCRMYSGFCYPMVGLHPEEIGGEWKYELSQMESLLEKEGNPFIAVGEVGLDYHFRSDNAAIQREVFREQINMASRFGLPLMIHARDAFADTLRLISSVAREGELTGVIHCFSGTEDEAREYLELPGFMLGIGGIVTFKNTGLRRVLDSVVPLERIVLETDSPYMAPVPMRGRRNEPSFIPFIAEVLAGVYSTTAAEICRITTGNARRTFPKAWENEGKSL